MLLRSGSYRPDSGNTTFVTFYSSLHSLDPIDSDKSSPARLQSFGYGGDRHKLGSALRPSVVYRFSNPNPKHVFFGIKELALSVHHFSQRSTRVPFFSDVRPP